MLDYSHQGEQLLIQKFFHCLGREASKAFLDIGAYDGITESNTLALAETGWQGVAIEPSCFAFASLIKTQGSLGIRCVQAALVPKQRITQFFDTRRQTSTMDWATASCSKEDHVTYWVLGITAEDVAQSFGSLYDFVSLDVEGMDLEVPRTMGPVLGKTQLLCLEAQLPGRPFDPTYYCDLLDAAELVGFSRCLVSPSFAGGKTRNVFLGRK
jgi:FkbM family methyltransferase